MATVEASVQIRAAMHVIPGPVTLAARAAAGEHWCPCHRWHRHGDGGFSCLSERDA